MAAQMLTQKQDEINLMRQEMIKHKKRMDIIQKKLENAEEQERQRLENMKTLHEEKLQAELLEKSKLQNEKLQLEQQRLKEETLNAAKIQAQTLITKIKDDDGQIQFNIQTLDESTISIINITDDEQTDSLNLPFLTSTKMEHELSGDDDADQDDNNIYNELPTCSLFTNSGTKRQHDEQTDSPNLPFLTSTKKEHELSGDDNNTCSLFTNSGTKRHHDENDYIIHPKLMRILDNIMHRLDAFEKNHKEMDSLKKNKNQQLSTTITQPPIDNTCLPSNNIKTKSAFTALKHQWMPQLINKFDQLEKRCDDIDRKFDAVQKDIKSMNYSLIEVLERE